MAALESANGQRSGRPPPDPARYKATYQTRMVPANGQNGMAPTECQNGMAPRDHGSVVRPPWWRLIPTADNLWRSGAQGAEVAYAWATFAS